MEPTSRATARAGLIKATRPKDVPAQAGAGRGLCGGMTWKWSVMCKYKYSSLEGVWTPGGESEACWRKLWAMGPMTDDRALAPLKTKPGRDGGLGTPCVRV